MARRLPLLISFPILLTLIFSAAWTFLDDTSLSSLGPHSLWPLFSPSTSPPEVGGLRISEMTRDEYINSSAPFPSFRQALVPGTNYMSIGLGAGLANQIIATMNLLLVSRLSNRIPVLSDFTRDYGHMPLGEHEHSQSNAGLPVDELFDLKKYTELTSFPTLGWRDLKSPEAPLERASCYESHDQVDRIIPASALTGNQATGESAIEVDIWSSPSSISDIHRIQNLVRFLGDEEGRKEHEEELLAKWGRGEIGMQLDGWEPRRPRGEFVCWSELYYFYTDRFDERWETSWPAWRAVGTHLHFAQPLLKVVEEYKEQVLGDPSKKYISIHARHGDFGRGTPPSTYLPHVLSLQSRHPSLATAPVLVFSDETDDAWWLGVKDQGWLRMDHEKLRTSQERGAWYPALIDMVLLSESGALIGTQASTFSLLAKLRVQDWGGGETILV
ncbi:hypothetical protein BDY24DRAFT_398063 [Mrakia frigida]|uniref:O-fucosyltransferase family protein n=1 Tax=Mrakia frigida TaxID=29902 RepID=UPI003FCBF392